MITTYRVESFIITAVIHCVFFFVGRDNDVPVSTPLAILIHVNTRLSKLSQLFRLVVDFQFGDVPQPTHAVFFFFAYNIIKYFAFRKTNL